MDETSGQGIPISRRANRIAPFLAMEIMERAEELERSGREIVHLEVGEPDFDTPGVIQEAGIRALRDGHTHYTHSMGHPVLREALAEWYLREYGVEVSPERVVVTVGSSGAMLLTFAAILEAGSEVILTNPHYACYPKFVTAFDGTPVPIPVFEEGGFQYDPEEVAARFSPRTRAVLLNSPSNPTGAVASPQELRRLAERIDGRALLISDEVYHGLVYGARADTILNHSPGSVVIGSFSKRFAMTGWRLGYALLPPELVRPIQKLQQNLFISAPDFAQLAAVAALEEAEPEVERMRRAYDRRRKRMLRRLEKMGIVFSLRPAGAFYVFANVGRWTEDVFSFAFRLLEEAGVAVTPGVDFGSRGTGYVRLSYATSEDRIEEGMNRLQNFLSRLA